MAAAGLAGSVALGAATRPKVAERTELTEGEDAMDEWCLEPPSGSSTPKGWLIVEAQGAEGAPPARAAPPEAPAPHPLDAPREPELPVEVPDVPNMLKAGPERDRVDRVDAVQLRPRCGRPGPPFHRVGVTLPARPAAAGWRRSVFRGARLRTRKCRCARCGRAVSLPATELAPWASGWGIEFACWARRELALIQGSHWLAGPCPCPGGW